MKTQVEFRTTKFQPYPDEDEFVNPGRFGKKLAEYLHNQLPAHGIEVEDIYPEDWGWRVMVKNDQFPVWIGCGNYEEYEDGFLCFIEPSKPYVRKFIKKIDTTRIVQKVKKAMDNILTSDAEIRGVRWMETGA